LKKIRRGGTKLKATVGRETDFHQKVTWQFNSLIQAIQIIHILNKTSHLNNSWEICRECASMFSKRDKHQRKFCSETCRNTAKVRNYREKKKNAT